MRGVGSEFCLSKQNHNFIFNRDFAPLTPLLSGEYDSTVLNYFELKTIVESLTLSFDTPIPPITPFAICFGVVKSSISKGKFDSAFRQNSEKQNHNFISIRDYLHS